MKPKIEAFNKRKEVYDALSSYGTSKEYQDISGLIGIHISSSESG